MTNKEKLFELIKEAEKEFSASGKPVLDIEEFVAGYLDKEGVLVPPCNVGDTFYDLPDEDNNIGELKVSSLAQKVDGTWKIRLTNLRYRCVFEITPDKIGKTVFASKEEAEKHKK